MGAQIYEDNEVVQTTPTTTPKTEQELGKKENEVKPTETTEQKGENK